MTLAAADGNFISVEDVTPVSNSVKKKTGGKLREPDVQVLKESLKFKLKARRSLGCHSSKRKAKFVIQSNGR